MLVKHWLPLCDMYMTSHKSHLYHLLGVLDFYVMYRQSLFCETSARVTNWVTDPFGWLCELL